MEGKDQMMLVKSQRGIYLDEEQKEREAVWEGQTVFLLGTCAIPQQVRIWNGARARDDK
jgi:hypothetical protein